MKPDKRIGTIIPNFTYDTPTVPGNDFYALCSKEKPLAMMFLPEFEHPVAQAYLEAYRVTRGALQSGSLACVVKSKPQDVAAATQRGGYPFPILCDAEGVLYEFLEVGTTTSVLDWSLTAHRLFRAARHETGYVPEKGEPQVLPLTLFLGEKGKVLFAHGGRSLTDLPEDCIALERVCRHLQEVQEPKAPAEGTTEEAVEDAAEKAVGTSRGE